jgi:hypothetical protein
VETNEPLQNRVKAPEVQEIAPPEMIAMLQRVGYGHLGCVRDKQPYVIPTNYLYDAPHIYLYTTSGMKTEFIEANPLVCLQVEEVRDSRHWQSVIVTGKARLLTAPDEFRKASDLLTLINPTHTPAISRIYFDGFLRENKVAIYCIDSLSMTGRKTHGPLE